MSVIGPERLKITVCSVCGEKIDGHRHQVFPNNGPGVMHEDSEQVEYVRADLHRGAVAWLSSDEAFEVAWRGAKSCGVGKVSPAQLTAALNALASHLGGQ